MTEDGIVPDRSEIDARIAGGFISMGIEYVDPEANTPEIRAVPTVGGQPYEPVDGVGRGEFAVPTEDEQKKLMLAEARAAAEHAMKKGDVDFEVKRIDEGQRTDFPPRDDGPFAPISEEKRAQIDTARKEVEKALLD